MITTRDLVKRIDLTLRGSSRNADPGWSTGTDRVDVWFCQEGFEKMVPNPGREMTLLIYSREVPGSISVTSQDHGYYVNGNYSTFGSPAENLIDGLIESHGVIYFLALPTSQVDESIQVIEKPKVEPVLVAPIFRADLCCKPTAEGSTGYRTLGSRDSADYLFFCRRGMKKMFV